MAQKKMRKKIQKKECGGVKLGSSEEHIGSIMLIFENMTESCALPHSHINCMFKLRNCLFVPMAVYGASFSFIS